MKSKRTLSLALALLLLGGSLVSCASGTDDPIDTGSQTTAAEEDENAIKDNLPADLNYGGDTITFISQYVEGITSGEIAVPELTSDPINDSVFERNKFVENRLNVKISHITENTTNDYAVVQKVDTAVKSGSKEYDGLTSPAYVVLEQALAGTFANLTGVASNIDMEQPWWTAGFNEACSFQGTQYAAAGSILLSTYRFAYATVFNKALFTDANQPFLYGYVEDGTWTLDKQASLVPLFHRDNGNGTQDASGDYYGFVTDLGIYVDPYWASCRVDIIGKNADGDYEMIFNIDRLHEAAEKALALYYETDGGTYLGSINSIFSQGFAAMATIRMLEMETSSMRNMEDAYGVVPMPRLTVNEDGYYSTLHDGFTVLSVPTTVRDDRLEEVTAVLEAMGSASYRIVKPAYYETTLRTKLVSDPQSSAMMDMIIENLRTDAGYINVYSFNSFHHGFRAIMSSKQNTVSSKYKGLQKSTAKMVKILNNKLTKLADTNA
jgi:hypothetical protein